MNDSREDAPVAQLAKKQEAMREKLEQRRERQAAKREKYRKLAADKSARQRRRRKKKEARHAGRTCQINESWRFSRGSGRKPDYFRKMGIKPISAAQLLEALV